MDVFPSEHWQWDPHRWRQDLAVLIGSTILVIGIAMNDQFGYTTGAPYSVHLKSAYGTKGNILPSMLRGLPAIVWYGYQTWLGGAAINNIVKLIFGYDNICCPSRDSRVQSGLETSAEP